MLGLRHWFSLTVYLPAALAGGAWTGSQVRLSGLLFAFPELGAPVLKPHLDARLAQVQLHGQCFALINIRVMDNLKRFLEMVQLASGERSPAASGLPGPVRETRVEHVGVHELERGVE